MKVLAVGDIHTKLWIITQIKSMVDDYDNIIFVGDYADDWNSGPLQTIETWKALKAFQDEYPDKVKLVIGNHDYIYVNNVHTISGGYNTVTQTLLNAPENEDIRYWLNALPYYMQIDHVTYTHAGIAEGWDYSTTVDRMWSDDSPIWLRPGSLPYAKIPQVFGHTPSETCWEVEPNVWCIDTFSTYPDDTPVGDYSLLEIVDGKTFNKIEMIKNDNNRIDGIKV